MALKRYLLWFDAVASWVTSSKPLCSGLYYKLICCNPPPCTTRYYNELWVLHLDELKWSVPALPAGGQAWPSARSGCQVSVSADTLFVYGGYSKVSRGGATY